MHRLNNTEYANTVRDLLFTDRQLNVTFPDDPSAHGFDNLAELLSVSPLLVEVYEAAATELLDDLFEFGDEETTELTIQGEGPGTFYDGGNPQGNGYSLAGGGSLSAPFNVVHDGNFEITVKASGRADESVFPLMRVLVNELEVATFEVSATGAGAEYTVDWPLDEGITTIRVELTNPDTQGDRGLVVDLVELVGPTDPEVGFTPGYTAIVESCDTDAETERGCAEQILGTFVSRAWRRPSTTDQVDWALGVYDAGIALDLGHEESMKGAMKAVLLAPEFVFRLEADAVDEPRQLDGYELASRLSYFLWSSMPDDALFAAAEDGSLLTDDGLRDQIARMIADEKAQALVDSFAGQWLDARTIDDFQPVMELYPDWDEPLRASMKEQMLRVAAPFFLDGEPLDGLFTSNETLIDARLAEHYGVPFDEADGEWQERSLLPERRGVLGTAGWLASHSRAERPSVVLRGKWVIEELMCEEVPPPPPGVDGSVVVEEGLGSVREQEEAARMTEGTSCLTCHSVMDPYGHALGNFDAIGALRAEDELGFPIDTVVTLPTGEEVESIVAGLDVIVADPRFSLCVAEKAFRYGLGREVRIEDAPYLEGYEADLLSADLAFEAVATSIILSEPFRWKGPLSEAE